MEHGPIRVGIVDAHPFIRRGVEAAVRDSEDLTFAHGAGDEAGASTLIRELSRQGAEPVVVLGLNLPADQSFDVLSAARAAPRPLPVIVLSGQRTESYLYEAMSRAAFGFASKDDPIDVVLDHVRAVASGRRGIVSPNVLRSVGPKPEPPTAPMTRREIDVLELMARGLKNERIAEALNLAADTIKNHVSSVFDKLGVADARGAIAWAYQSGLVGTSSE